MPTNHGIYFKCPTTTGQSLTADDIMKFRYGIWRIFDALPNKAFSLSSEDKQRARQLEYHFRTVCQRFVYILQQLNVLMQELADCFAYGQPPAMASMAINLKAECLADQVLTYLNTIVDDIAVVIVRATSAKPTGSKPIDSMGKLRGARDLPNLAAVKSLLDETFVTGSWWELAFTTGSGARQLIIHNQHLVQFQLAATPGSAFKVRSVVMSPFAQQTFPIHDYFGLLRNVLSGLFEWLDLLEEVLVSELQSKGIGWSPHPTCPSFALPVGYPVGTTRYVHEYFPIPTCNGSDDLPWTVTVPDSDVQ